MAYLTPEQQEDAKRVWDIFMDMRKAMLPYFEHRQVELTNYQFLSFMLSAPLTMAIALDNMLDAREEVVLDYYAEHTHKNMLSQFSEITYSIFDMMPEKKEVQTLDEELSRIIKEEAIFMLDQSRQWKSTWIAGLKELLRLEPILQRYNPNLRPLRDTFVEGMVIIIKTNLGSDVLEERKFNEILKQLEIELEPGKMEKILLSLR